MPASEYVARDKNSPTRASHQKEPVSAPQPVAPQAPAAQLARRALAPADILALQRTVGNAAVNHLLQHVQGQREGLASPHPASASQAQPGGTGPIQLGRDPDFTFNGAGIEPTTISSQEELNDEVESLIDEHFGGLHNLFLQNKVATSPGQWAALVYDHLGTEELYDMEGLGQPQVLIAINWLKDKHREEMLLNMARTQVYWVPERLTELEIECFKYPHDRGKQVAALKGLMQEAGAYLEAADDATLGAIVATEGKFARTKVEVPAGNLELSDEDNIVVLMDDHQQKHQRDQIPQFKAYTGQPGTKFAVGKGLAWHVANTVPVVRQTVSAAVNDETVSPVSPPYSPPKDAIDGIIYDLTITYDDGTGKYVGSYHCNPVNDE